MKAREGFVESAGHHLGYLTVNEHLDDESRPAVVFIHGVLASVNFWRACLPPPFLQSRAWFALSLPAHHPSTVPTDFSLGEVDDAWFFRVMNGALEALLGSRPVIVVGHSTGGFCGLNLALHQAPSVVGVVSIAGFHSGDWGGVEGQLVKLAGLGAWARPLFALNIELARHSRFIQSVFSTLLANDKRAYRASPLSVQMLDAVRPNVCAQDADALFILFHGIRRLDVGPRLHEVRVPVYIFAGTHDPVVAASQALLLAGEVPNAHTVVLRGVGHMPFMEVTETFFAALTAALDDLVEHAGLPRSIEESP